MAVSVIPELTDALVAAADAAKPSGWKVTDGYWVSDEVVNLLQIGGSDPDDPNPQQAAGGQQDWAHVNSTDRDEIGEIFCSARAYDPDGNVKAARDAVAAAVEALAAAVRANPSLGVASLLWTSFGGQSEWLTSQDQNGAKALLTFRIGFRAQI